MSVVRVPARALVKAQIREKVTGPRAEAGLFLWTRWRQISAVAAARRGTRQTTVWTS